jgi:hypothetical protein
MCARVCALMLASLLILGCSDDSGSSSPDSATTDLASLSEGGFVDAAVGLDLPAGTSLASVATVRVSFNEKLLDFVNDGVKEGDKPDCAAYYYWYSKFPRDEDKWIELSWSAPVTIGRVDVDTIVATGTPHPSCKASDVGRTFGSQPVEVQVDDGQGGWTKVADVDAKTDDWSVSFTPQSATKLRLLTPGTVKLNTNPVVFEVEVFAQ